MKVAVVVLATGLLSYLVDYLGSMNSGAFTEAQMFIIQSPTINRELGNNIDVQLAPFGYELEFSGSSGAATFKGNFKGSRGQGKVKITLDKVANIWRVTAATPNSNDRLVNTIHSGFHIY